MTKLIPSPPAWRRRLARLPSGPASLALLPMLMAGHVLAADQIGTVVSNITVWIIGILAGLATLFLTIGGVRYLMAGGDPGEVEKAKGAFKSALIGYGLAALAPVVVTILKAILGIT